MTTAFDLVCWNLFGLEEHELDERTEAAVHLSLLGGRPEDVIAAGLRPVLPGIVMFQEVVDRSLFAHLLPQLQAAGYQCAPTRHHAFRHYYELIAVRPPFKVVDVRTTRFESEQGRELLEVRADADGAEWLIMTSHLESMREGSRLRVAQARQVIERIEGHEGPVVFGADTNLRVHEAATLAPPVDAWQASGADPAQRWTRISRSGRQRYDRIWARGVRLSGFRCFGRDPVTPDGEPPSDHLGIRVHVQAP